MREIRMANLALRLTRDADENLIETTGGFRIMQLDIALKVGNDN